MTLSLFAARAAVAAVGLALIALAALHVLKPEIHPGRSMISQYALGRFGWLMTLFFAGLALASGCLMLALVANLHSVRGRAGLFFLTVAALGLAMAARYRMDPVSTSPARMSRSGKLHGISFLVGVPSQLLAVLFLSLALGDAAARPTVALFVPACVVWLGLLMTILIMVRVGPGNTPDPNGPVRFLGLANRLFIGAYAAWLVIAAWPWAAHLP